MSEEYKLEGIETVRRSKYGNKTNDQNELYMETINVFTFRNDKDKKLKISLNYEDVQDIYNTLKNINF